jgi:hypothetical protein
VLIRGPTLTEPLFLFSTAGSSAGPKSKAKGKAAIKRKVSEDSDDDEEGTPLTKKLQKAAPGQGELKVKSEDNDDED